MSSTVETEAVDSRFLLSGTEDAALSPARETTPLTAAGEGPPSLTTPASLSKLRTASRIQVLSTNKRCVTAVYGCLYAIYLAVAILVILAFYFLLSKDENVENHILAWGIGALAVAVAVPLALHDIVLHLLHWTLPDLQKNYVRIL
jgi:hypothetical protein